MEVQDVGPQPPDRGSPPGGQPSGIGGRPPITPAPAPPDTRHAGAPSAALSRIRLRHLSCFVVVAQERTLARAAERLHLSQPAVSKTLTELERLAGHPLVERSRAGTRLTEAGERFLRYALDVTRAPD